ncbi:MAG: hypothetical protein ACWA5L_04410 [bacterium]
MSDDRLKQIWSGFEKTTSRNLTGRGIDNIPRPVVEEMDRHRTLLEDAHHAASVPMPEGVTEPAAAAFSALRSRLSRFDEKGRVEKPRSGQSAQLDVEVEDQLLRDLKATEMLTSRRDGDYDSWFAAREEERLSKKKRKKFLGIF